MKPIVNRIVTDMKVHTIVLIILIVLSICSYSWYSDISDAKNTINSTKSYTQKLEELAVTSVVQCEINKAKIQSSLVSENITNDILTAYGNDKVSLKNDFISDNPDARLFTIISSDIQDKFINKDTINNKILVVSNNKILSTSFNTTNPFKRNESAYDFFSVNQDNSSLTSILKHSTEYTIFNKDNDKLNLSTLANIYDTYGTDGFKNIYLLVPSYITNFGDILGVSDLDATGVPQSNNKMIIIQQVSLYDAMMLQRDKLNTFDATKNSIQSELNSKFVSEYYRNYVLIGLILIVALLAVSNKSQINK